MRITIIVSPDEVREAIKLNRTWKDWLKLLAVNWYASLLSIVMVGALIARLVAGKGITLDQMLVLLIPIGFVGFIYIRQRNYAEKSAQSLSDLGGIAEIEDDGLHGTASSGATSFQPWSIFSAWKEGPNVFTLGKEKNFLVLPKRGLSETELNGIRLLFQSKIS